jgi:hypothetical protein
MGKMVTFGYRPGLKVNVDPHGVLLTMDCTSSPGWSVTLIPLPGVQVWAYRLINVS